MIRSIARAAFAVTALLLVGCANSGDGHGLTVDPTNTDPDIDEARRKLAILVADPGADCLPALRPDAFEPQYLATKKRRADRGDIVVDVAQGRKIRWRLYGEDKGTGFTVAFKDTGKGDAVVQYFKNKRCQINASNEISSNGRRYLQCTWRSLDAIRKDIKSGADGVSYGIKVDSCANPRDPRVYIRNL